MTIALTVICGLACAGLVAAERRGARGLRAAAKLTASAAFVAVGASAFAAGPPAPLAAGFAPAVMLGLVLGAIGDACLLRSETRWFLAGLVAFLCGHLAYVVGIAMIEPIGRWPADAGWLGALPIGAGLITLGLLWRRLGSMRGPVIGYVAAICAMVVAAIAASRGAALPSPQRGRLLVGAALFFASDLAVARDRFIGHAFANKLWGLPAYFAGQLCFAWTLVAAG